MGWRNGGGLVEDFSGCSWVLRDAGSSLRCRRWCFFARQLLAKTALAPARTSARPDQTAVEDRWRNGGGWMEGLRVQGWRNGGGRRRLCLPEARLKWRCWLQAPMAQAP